MTRLRDLAFGLGFTKNQIRNRLSTLMFLVFSFKRRDFSIQLRNGRELIILGRQGLMKTEEGFLFKYNMSRKNLLKSIIYTVEIFYSEIYQELRVDGQETVDIGSGSGISPFYFIMKGAKRVIAIERDSEDVRLAESNYTINKCHNISQLNKTLVSDNGCQISPDQVSIEQIIANFDLKNFVLKIDCEGCEYGLFEGDIDWLRNVDELIVEYHGNSEPITSKLTEFGFSLSFPQPHVSAHLSNWNAFLIYAKRNTK